MTLNRNARWIALTVVAAVVLGGLSWGAYRVSSRRHTTVAKAAGKDLQPDDDAHQEEDQHGTSIQVKVVVPKKGELQRLSTQPGSLHAFKSVRLFAKVPGFLREQTVPGFPKERTFDIGDTVKKGQVLAKVDVPELEAQLRRTSAAVKQAEAKVLQMDARVKSAKADLVAANASVNRADAAEKSAAAWVRYRLIYLRRIESLVALKSLEQKLEDEAKEHYEASLETQRAAVEAITANKAMVVACEAKIDQAQADVKAAEAEVKVAEAEHERVHALVSYATITAPFDGVITTRGMFEDSFVRAANDGSNIEPLFTVNRTDRFRVVVLIPDRDVPFTDVGDLAEIEIDSLPGKVFQGKVSRFAESLDPQTRLMRVEIDLPNPTGQLKQGMYGQVSIVLDQERGLWSIPTSCLVAQNVESKIPAPTGNIRFDFPTRQPTKNAGDEASVFVVRAGHLKLIPIRLGTNNGLRAAVLSGLGANDRVVMSPNQSLTDGAEVTPILWDETGARD